MRSNWEDITAAKAAADLETAACGRKPSMVVIERYARDMENDRWRPSPEPVVYDGDEPGGKPRLRDGQQRYFAAVEAALRLAEAGKIPDPDKFSVRLWVTRGTTAEIDEAFPYINTGKPRTGGDMLNAEGYANSTMLNTVARRVVLWEAGQPTGTNYRPTRAEIMDVVTHRDMIVEAAEYANGWKVRPPVPAPGTAGFLWYLLGTVNKDDRDTFMNYLRTGSGIDDENPDRPHILRRLRNRLHADAYDARNRNKTIRPEGPLWLCLRAWQAWQSHEEMRKLQMPVRVTDASFADFLKALQPRR